MTPERQRELDLIVARARDMLAARGLPDQVQADDGERMRIKNAKSIDWRNIK